MKAEQKSTGAWPQVQLSSASTGDLRRLRGLKAYKQSPTAALYTFITVAVDMCTTCLSKRLGSLLEAEKIMARAGGKYLQSSSCQLNTSRRS